MATHHGHLNASGLSLQLYSNATKMYNILQKSFLLHLKLSVSSWAYRSIVQCSIISSKSWLEPSWKICVTHAEKLADGHSQRNVGEHPVLGQSVKELELQSVLHVSYLWMKYAKLCRSLLISVSSIFPSQPIAPSTLITLFLVPPEYYWNRAFRYLDRSCNSQGLEARSWGFTDTFIQGESPVGAALVCGQPRSYLTWSQKHLVICTVSRQL